MEEQLLDFIKSVRSDKGIESYSEAKTKQAIILRCLNILGWDAFNVDEVYPEYSVGKDRVDYSLRLDGANKVFLEAKKVSEDLEKHQKQLLNYSFQQGVKLAILTNGVTWWFYLPLHEGDWEQRKFYSIDIHQQAVEDVASKFVDFLSKENITSGSALDNAEAVYKSQQRQKILQATLPKAWNMIISEPDSLLMDLVNETAESICGYRADDDTVKRFLSRHKNQLMLSVGVSEITPSASTHKATISSGSQDLSPIAEPITTDFKDKEITSFYFAGLKHKVDSWRGLLFELSKLINSAHRNDFDKVLELKGSKRSYFTRDENMLTSSKQIPDTDIFVEQNLSARNVAQVCRSLIALFGYSDDDLKIGVHGDKDRDSESGEYTLDGKFSGQYAHLRPVFDAIESKIMEFGNDIKMNCPKNYIPFMRNKCFASCKVSKQAIVIGLSLDESVEPHGRLRDAPKNWSGWTRARVSRIISVSKVEDIDDQLIGWMKQSYDRS